MKKYDSYNDSDIDWIGEIPSHWKIMPLKYCFNIVSGATPKTERKEFWDGGIIWITPADYKTEDHFIEKGNRNITLQGLNSCGTEIVPKGSLIFSKRAPIGTISIANTDLCTNQGCLSCVPKDKIESNFFYYLLTQPIKEFEILGSGATFLEISTTNFSNFDIPVPPLSEQKEIADYLDRKCSEIDAAVAKVDKEVELLDELKQSEISKTVTKGLNPKVSNQPSGIDWIGEIPSHWKIMPLKYVADIIMGQSPNGSDIKDKGCQLFMQGNAEFGLIYPQPTLYCESCNKFSRIGDILMSVRAPVGELNLSDKIYGIGRGLCSIKAVKLIPNYLWYFLIKSKSDFNIFSNGSTFEAITVDTLSNLTITFPPLSEQKEIADYLDKKCGEIDSLKEKLNQKKKKLQELRQSLISEVVTGKRKVI